MRLSTSICAVLLIGTLTVACAYHAHEQQATDAAVPSGWSKVDAVAFSVFAPSSWQFRQLQGIDSYVGEFTGDGIVLKFDFGRYSNPLQEEKEPAYVVVYKSVGGLSAKIVNPKLPGHGVTGIYFPRAFGSNKLSLFGQDLTSIQQELVLRIFGTIRFGNAVPPFVVPPPTKSVQ